MTHALLFLLLINTPALCSGTDNDSARSYEFLNANWFDGKEFVKGTFFSVNGVFSFHRPSHVDSIIDLKDRYVVPPYAEAHNHNIDGFKKVEDRISRYIHDGIFYIKNPNSIPRFTATLTGKINTSSSVDVVFSNGGLTASDGHPLELVRRNIGLGIFTERDAEGGMYYLIDSREDLNAKWRRILADKPDFLKTYLLYSEEFAKRKEDTSFFGWKGLDPSLLPNIVQRAHTAGLRVSTHIETAADFHNALASGSDEINHMPGFRADSALDFSRYEISDEDARDAASGNVVVVTTLEGTGTSGSTTYQARLRQLHIRNLTLLKKYGVRIAIGSDNYRQTSTPEAMYLSRLGVFTNAELLKMWTETSANTIFPNRKIGKIREGFEASFLVLDANPLKDFSYTQNILTRFKQGAFLPPENASPR